MKLGRNERLGKIYNLYLEFNLFFRVFTFVQIIIYDMQNFDRVEKAWILFFNLKFSFYFVFKYHTCVHDTCVRQLSFLYTY